MDVHARILLWGVEGAGKSTTLRTIHAKLRPELRGDLKTEATRLDPTLSYESLAITLGEVGGAGTQIEIIAVPGATDQAMTRKQLLDEVDGIIFVIDSSPERIDANYGALDELRASLAAYGQRLDAFPVVLQYNKRDIADPFAIEALHRRIGLQQAAVFETIATTGHGVLATLTTISKHVVRARRADGGTTKSANSAPAATIATAAEIDDAAGSSHDILEAAILAEGDEVGIDELSGLVELDPADAAQPDWAAVSGTLSKPDGALGQQLRVVSVGQGVVDQEGGLRLPLVLGDEAGQTRSLVLSLRLDSLVVDGGD